MIQLPKESPLHLVHLVQRDRKLLLIGPCGSRPDLREILRREGGREGGRVLIIRGAIFFD